MQGSKTDFKSLFFLINIYFQEAFSQSDFQKGPELNKQIYNEDIYVIYRLGGPDRKIFCRGLKNGPRPKTKYFSIRTDLNGK